MSIAVCGSIGIDTIENKHGKFEDRLGGSATYFSLGAAFFTQVYIFASIGKDLDKKFIDILKNNGNISTHYLRVSEKFNNFRWHGKYSDDFENVQTISADYNILSENVLENEIKEKFDIIFLANTDPDIQYKMLEYFSYTNLLFSDTMTHWIETKRAALEKLLSRIWGLFINEEEAKKFTHEYTTLEASNKIRKFGPKLVIIKKGEDGVLINYLDRIILYSGYPIPKIVDTTGAGDSFAGAFLGYIDKCSKIINMEILKRAAIWGNVIASFTCEGIGPDKLLNISKSDIENRFQNYLDQLRV